jgi:hypothetical protein
MINRIRLNGLSERVQATRNRVARPRSADSPSTEWALRRGDQLFAGTFDAIGNFPGFEHVAGLIVNAEVVVTSRFLLVDEGVPHGFALGIGWLVDVSPDPDPDTFGDVLVRYRSDDANVLFRLRPARSRLFLRNRSRPEELLAALSDAGAEQGELARDLASVLRLSWDSVQSLDSESVIWRGEATAPLRPGLECAPAAVWVTPTALVWGSVKGKGVNRLPINTVNRLASFTLTDEQSAPTVYVRTRVISDVRLDLPFIFNLAPLRESVARRGEFLALFRSESVIEGVGSARPQPWLDEPSVAAQNQETEEDEGAAYVPEDDTSAASSEAEPEFESWANVTKPTQFPYVPPGDRTAAGYGRRIDAGRDQDEPGFDSSGTRLVEAISSWPGEVNRLPEPESTDEPPPTQPDAILRYLADAERTINEVNEAIDRRLAGQPALSLRATPPSSDDQAKALAELLELTGSDYYSFEQARSVKSRITRLGEISVRLRSLIELCNAGHLTAQEVGHKRDTLVASIPPKPADD